MAEYDERGREIMDQTPLEVPLNFRPPLTLAEEIRRMVRRELSQAAEASGMESFEESDDFEIDDDDDLEFVSPYEILEMKHDGPIESLDGTAEDRASRDDGDSGEDRTGGEGAAESAPRPVREGREGEGTGASAKPPRAAGDGAESP